MLQHKVVVYGTLLKGFGNHRKLKDAEFLGEVLVPDVEMRDYNGAFPMCFPKDGETVHGELYAVNHLTLKRLDVLESHPVFYIRKKTEVLLEDGDEPNIEIAYIYLGNEEYTDKRGLHVVNSGCWRTYRQEGIQTREDTIHDFA